jgi:hypothetical protein
MKVIITKKLYHELGIVNRSIRYIENISLIDFEWIQKDVTMHPLINVLVNFNDFLEKNIKLQNIKLKGIPKNVIPIIPYQGFSNIITYRSQTHPKHSQSIDINCHLPQLFVL